MMTTSTASVEEIFTATSKHSNWPQSKLHTQWPGTGVVGDPTFDAFYASQIQFMPEIDIYETQNTEAYSALLDKIGIAHLVTHSQAGTYGWRIGDARPTLVKSIVALEPSGPPFEGKAPSLGDRPWGITIQEIAYDPPAGPNATFLEKMTVLAKDTDHYDCILQREPAKRLKNLADIPVLVVTGEASFHAPYDCCTVAYLKQAGVQVEHVELAEEGIQGNGHMFFMEKNNVQSAERVLKWLTAL
jgi:pimeloyl-ACP methyl ester carboxylesterase